MAKSKMTGPGPLKIAGAIVILCASVGLFYKRMPHREYVAAHADKPRPKAETDVQSPSPAPAAAPAAAPRLPKPPPVMPQAAAPQSAETAAPTIHVKADLSAVCSVESGILCYEVPAWKLRSCLAEYDPNVFLSDCRAAMKSDDR